VRAILFAALIALAGCHFQEPPLRGTVVEVMELLQAEPPDESGKSYEHPLVPEVAWKVEVQLDDGGAVTVMHEGERRYEPGERVRLLLDQNGALLL
jgi:hypothetical protein